MPDGLSPEQKTALYDFQRYLSDELAPLMALDAAEKVIELPPQLVAAQIQSWISSRFRGRGADIPVSDYLFHAAQKFHHLAELDLIPRNRISAFLATLKGPLLEICPPEDREFLEANLALIGEGSSSGMGADPEFLFRQPGSESKLASDRDIYSGRADLTRRLDLIVERLASDRGGPIHRIPGARNRVISEAVTTAASIASSGPELEENLSRVRGAGVDVDPAQLFRYLGNSLPEWAVPIPEFKAGQDEMFPESEGQPLEAMKRLLTFAEDPQERLRRFRQFFEAAVEQFNQGSIGRAVTMMSLAERLIESGGLAQEETDRIRRTAGESLDPARLRGSAETPEAHYLLRKFLDFFPGFRPSGILEGLKKEDRRDRRRLLLALIEVHGEEARDAALKILQEGGGTSLGNSDPYFARNLFYVLNRVNPVATVTDEEIRLAEAMSSLGHPAFLIKEAVAVLAQGRHPRAEEILTVRLREYETALAGGNPPHPATDMRQIIDRVVTGLIRIDTPSSLLAAIEHGLTGQAVLGDTLRRLAPLGQRDLSSSPSVVKRLIDAVRERLPRKILGVVMQRQSGEELDKLLDALAGTSSPEVLELLESIREKYSDRSFGAKASSILDNAGLKSATSMTAAPKLSGDLELFGLPNLVQNLGSNEVTGVLTLVDREGKRLGAIGFDHGRIIRCFTGNLRGKDAFFQLFERAMPGTFTFVERSDIAREEPESPPMEVTPLIMEALRRFDELRAAKANVPPEVGLVPTATKPVHDERETDPKVIREVWLKAASGEAPQEWEHQIPVDSYRIWRLLTHWVRSGALALKQ